MSPFYSIMTPY